jgi:hypothetical protein
MSTISNNASSSISRMRIGIREDFPRIITTISRLTQKEKRFEDATLPRLPDHSPPLMCRPP